MVESELELRPIELPPELSASYGYSHSVPCRHCLPNISIKLSSCEPLHSFSVQISTNSDVFLFKLFLHYFKINLFAFKKWIQY